MAPTALPDPACSPVMWTTSLDVRSGDVVVMDDLSSHKRSAVREHIRAVGATLHFLPPRLQPCRESFRPHRAGSRHPSKGLAGLSIRPKGCPALIVPPPSPLPAAAADAERLLDISWVRRENRSRPQAPPTPAGPTPRTGSSSPAGAAVRVLPDAARSADGRAVHHRARLRYGRRREESRGDDRAPAGVAHVELCAARPPARSQRPPYRHGDGRHPQQACSPLRQKEATLPEDLIAMLETLPRGSPRDRGPCAAPRVSAWIAADQTEDGRGWVEIPDKGLLG